MEHDINRRSVHRLLILAILTCAAVMYPPRESSAWPECGRERIFFYDAEHTQYAGIRYREPSWEATMGQCNCAGWSDGEVAGYSVENDTYCS